MDVLRVAQEAGLAVLLEARIGRQEYSSVSGSKDALLRFAEAIRTATVQELRLRARLKLHSRPSQCWWRSKGKRAGTSPASKSEDLLRCGAETGDPLIRLRVKNITR
ncbi:MULTISPECIES: hypothetical protein [unclassified Burkholderia]|uniref:hypothetical protein n=1 Tax=unclassified Burkholderia TaxID=2613784 RepID=UPI001E3C6E10|nr:MULTISPECIES: hypothetical protein [unclassified Burkholderia]UEP33217.1 hypothetical protein LMA01_32465 [Burkholderia sp. B21-007]UEP46670.1 hypothetical protein LMA02_33850 [Burkholderia sp. B21-005]